MDNPTVQLGSTMARSVAAQQQFWAHLADSGEPEVRGRWEMGLGMTPEWKNPDWRSWGGRGLTDEAIHGGVP
jgi:hypothetical protein